MFKKVSLVLCMSFFATLGGLQLVASPLSGCTSQQIADCQALTGRGTYQACYTYPTLPGLAHCAFSFCDALIDSNGEVFEDECP